MIYMNYNFAERNRNLFADDRRKEDMPCPGVERICYNDAFELQRKLVSARSNNEIEDTLILLNTIPLSPSRHTNS